MSNVFDQFDDDDDFLRPGPEPGLGERFRLNVEAGYRQNTILGATRDASTESRRQDRRRFDERVEAFPEWSGFLEGGAALGGQLVGTAASVENFVPVGLGARIVATGKTGLTGLWAHVFAGAVDAAAVNAGTDTAIQGIELGAGFREGFDPVQLAAGTALGGIIGGAGGAVARGVDVLRTRAASQAKNVFDQFDPPAQDAPPAAPDTATAAPEAPAAPDTATVAPDAPPATPDAPQVEPDALQGAPDAAPDAPQVTPDAPPAALEAAPDTLQAAPDARQAGPDAPPDAVQVVADASLGERLSDEASRTRGVKAARPGDGVLARTAPDGAPDTGAGTLARVQSGDASRPSAGRAGGAEAPEFPRVRETAEKLARMLNVASTRQGRLRGRSNVLGQFFTRSGAVRVRSLDDFDTLTHEYGHHVDAMLPEVKGWIKANSNALSPLDYDPAQARDYEGFAEFFRLWLTNRAYLQKNHPALSAGFDALLAGNDDLRAAIDEASAAYAAFLQAPSTVAVLSTIVSSRRKGWAAETSRDLREQGVAGTISDVLNRLYTFFLDDLNPLRQAVDHLSRLHRANTGRALDLNVSADAYKLARLSRGAFSAGHMDVMHGVAPYRGLNPQTPSLRDAIVEATGKPNALSGWDDVKVREFGAYLWSRRALGEWERFKRGAIPRPPDKLTEGDHVMNVREMEAANPQFRSAAEKVYEWNLALWAKKLDAGLISRQVYEEGLRIRDYVPGLRDWSSSAADERLPAGKPRRAKDLKYGVSRRFQGSRRDVINPLESLVADAYETAMTISRNDVVKSLARLARTAGLGGARIAEEIPTSQLRATMVDPLEAIETAARNAGLSKPDAIAIRDALEGTIGDEKVAIFRPAMISEKGEPIVFFRDGGDLRALRLADGAFGRDMYRALTSMSQQERNFWLELVAMPARVLRLGITTSFDFIGANFVRDQTMAWVYFGKPMRRVAASLRGAADDFMSSAAARAYSRVGGITGGQETASLAKMRAERDLSRLQRRGWIAQRLTSFRGVLEAVEIAETASRMGLFRTFIQEAKARGLDDMEAALEASWQARDYMDFDRRGSGMAALARVIPFLNAAMQGSDKTARLMMAPLARRALGLAPLPGDDAAMGTAVKAWARLASLTVAGMSLYALMSQHEDHDEISDYLRATHWMVKSGEKWTAIPKPFELGAVLNLGEAAFSAMAEKDPTALGRWLDNLHFSLAPPSILEGNPAIKSYFELRTNTNLFTGGDIVPEWLAGMEPWLQYTARTSELSKQLGELFDMSPAVLDHLILNHLASWGRSALALYDLAQPDAPAPGWDDVPIVRRFIKDASKGSQSVTRFWDLMGSKSGTLEGKARSYAALSPSDRADYFARQDDQSRAYIALSTHKAAVKRLNPMVRARNAVQAINSMRRDMATGVLRDEAGQPQAVSSVARGAADDVLGKLSMAISRNALVAVGEEGWVQRDPIDEGGFYRELDAIDPDLLRTLGSIFAEKRVWRADAVEAAWPDLRERLLANGTDALTADLVAEVEAAGLAIEGALKRPKADRPRVPAGG
uniref:LPD38 domain-containing protein n=1 Tax=Stappia sp. TaxID=1870903 RepID=UPI003BA88B5F